MKIRLEYDPEAAKHMLSFSDVGYTTSIPVHVTSTDRIPGVPELEIELPAYVQITAGVMRAVEPSTVFRG